MSEWKKVRLGDVCKIEKGSTGIASAIPGEYPLVVTAAERKTSDSYQFDCSAVCIPLVSSKGHGVKALNHVHYQNGKFALGSILCAVIPKNEEELDARYLHQYLQFYKDSLLVRLMKGAANVSLSMKDIATVEVPLPPINKQKELAEMFVKLQEKSVRIQEEFEKEKNYIKQLRQNILQDAIEGKLTEDWRNKYPVQKGDINYDVECLLSKIYDKRKSNYEKKDCFGICEEPFPIPQSWKWCRLGDVAYNCDGNRLPIRHDMRVAGDYPYYGASGIIDFVSGYTHEGEFLLIGEDGANLLSKSTPLAFEASGRIWVNNHAHVLCFENRVMLKFYIYCLNGLNLDSFITGGFQPKLNQKNLNSIPVVLPPLAEQNEIVSRVESSLKKINDLEQQIITRETLAKTLLQTTLHTTFQEG